MKYVLYSAQSLNFARGHRLSTGQSPTQTKIYMPDSKKQPFSLCHTLRKLNLFRLRHRGVKTNLTYNCLRVNCDSSLYLTLVKPELNMYSTPV